MKKCEQASGLSIYQHGLDVANRYRDLWNMLEDGRNLYDWSIVDETLQQLKLIKLKALDPKQARQYHIFHDCGKPLCQTIDADGRKHFPHHAAKSAQIYRAILEDDETAELIELDMWCHTAKGEEIDRFIAYSHAPTLLLTAWAEIHANAEMFGGFDSISFKIKKKQLTKITKRLHRSLSYHAKVGLDVHISL